MMCDDCIFSKDSTCTCENTNFNYDGDCLSKLDKETYSKIYNKAIDDVGKALLNKIYGQNIKMIIYGDGIDTFDTQIFPYKLWDSVAEQLKAGGEYA